MSLIDSINSEGSTIDVNSLIEPQRSTAPFAAVRNRAATAALLGKDEGTGVEDYQLMLSQGLEGVDSFRSEKMNQMADSNKKLDMQGVVSILSDPKLPMAEKEKAISGIRNSQFLNDSGNNLLTKNLAKPVKGESVEGETVRLTSADIIRKMQEDRQKIQGLVNAHALSLDDSSDTRIIGEAAELMVLPLMNNYNVSKVVGDLKKKRGENVNLWDYVKAFVLPGNAMMNERTRLESLPVAKQLEYQAYLNKTLKEQSGLLFSSDNQYAQFEKQMALSAVGSYSTVEQYLDNISGVLDVVGLGSLTRRFKPLKTADALDGTERAVTAPPSPPTAPSSPIPDTQSVREVKQAKAKAEIEKQWAFDPSKSTPDSNAPVKAVTEPVDNVPTLLGGTGRRAAEEVPEKKIAALLQRVEVNNTVRIENPASPAKIVQQANPDEAIAIHTAIVRGQGDAAAEALYGTRRTDAIASDILPQVVVGDGRVTTRVPDIGRGLRQIATVDESILEVVHSRGMTEITLAEKQEKLAAVQTKFEAAEGLTINDAMSSFSIDGGRIKIGAVYGTPEGGFLRAEDAVEQAKYALRNTQFDPANIEILAKDGLDHVPVRLEDVVGKDGNYMIRVNAFEDVTLSDLSFIESLTVKRNLADRILPLVSNTRGSLANHLMDNASMLAKEITGSAANVSDVSARLEKVLLDFADNFATKFNKLSNVEKERVNTYVKEANYNQLAFDPVDLGARGWNAEMVETVRAWRQYWDNHYYLENLDVVRTQRANGFQLFETQTERHIAKPVAKNQNIGKFYDPATGTVVHHAKADGDALYNANGTYAQLRRPITVGSDSIDHIIVRNTPQEHLRNLRDGDRVLNYREGYYQIQYTAPRFVEKAEIVNGQKVWKAVAVAGDMKEAEHFQRRMITQTQGEYRVRGDDRALSRSSDAFWDLNAATGRIAQRVRGKLLEDASGLNHLGDGSYILNPVESAIRAAKSISGRTMSRPMLETAKARAIKQYGEMFPPNSIGGKRWPSSVEEIKQTGEFTTKELADARTTWVYINYLENGYLNTVDQTFKYVMHGMADMFGKAGWAKGERAVGRIAEEAGGPVGLAKNAVFMAYIGTNVLRQLIIQPHQIVRTFAYNPKGWMSGNVHKLMAEYIGDIAGIAPKTPDGKDFVDFIKSSGFFDNVDKQNLVRGVLSDAAETNSKAVRIAKGAYNLPRKIGFDIGEMANMLGHAAATYDLHKRQGKAVSTKVGREEAYSEIRAISYDMNFAGDMPYNQTSAALVLQFMQVPHKAFLQMTNRRIPVDARMRMLVGDMILWGPPTLLVSELLGGDVLSDNPELREMFVWGMESFLLNEMFQIFSGDDTTRIDYSSFAPYELTGWKKFFEAMMTGGPEALVLNSPAGQLFLKDGSRVQVAMQSMARFFTGWEQYDEDPQTFLEVMTEVAKISSGFSNAYKAGLLLDAQKRLDQYGSVIDKSVDHVEAWHQLVGFTTADTRDYYTASQKFSKAGKDHKDEVLKAYNGIKRYYASKLEEENVDLEFIQKVSGRVLLKFKDDPEAMKIIKDQMKLDFNGKDQNLIYQMMKAIGMPEGEKMRDVIRMAPLTPEQKDQALQRLDDVEKLRNVVREN